MVKKLIYKTLIKMCMVLGAAVIPVSVHAAYGVREPDSARKDYVRFQGIVISEETGEPIPGIVYGSSHGVGHTDAEGHFSLYLPEEDSCIYFIDMDGFENGGFFIQKNIVITRKDIGNTLTVGLSRENDVPVVVRGTVISGETGSPISGIRVSVMSLSDAPGLFFDSTGFEVLSDDNGQFSLQVPKRDTYTIVFRDTRRVFQPKGMRLALTEIISPLRVGLVKIR